MSRKSCAATGSEVSSRSTRSPGGTMASSAARRRWWARRADRCRRGAGGRRRTPKAVVRLARLDVDGAAEPRCRYLEPVRPAVRAQRDGLAVGDEVGDRQGQRRLDHLGQPGGDVVEAAGVDRRRRRRARWICTRAPSSLASKIAVAAESFERVVDAGRGLGEHRADRAPDLQGESASAAAPAGQAPPRRRRAGRRRAWRPAAPRGGDARRPWRPRRPSARPARPGATRRRAGGAGTICSIVGGRGEQPSRAARRGGPASPCPRRRRSR